MVYSIIVHRYISETVIQLLRISSEQWILLKLDPFPHLKRAGNVNYRFILINLSNK